MSSCNTVLTGIEGLDKLITGFPRGGLITVSGNPGTGKTALAGAFIHNGALKYGEPGVYASFLEDEERFYNFMAGFGLDFRSLKEKGLFKYLAIPTLFEPGTGISVADIVETVENMGAKRLVIDSFTALSQMFKSPPEARVFLHSLLSKIARQMDCTTILIKELPSEQSYEYGFEEFISDGVIHLRREIIEDRLFREIRILKMRGSQVIEPLACMSLYKGFRVYPPMRITEEYYKNKRFEPPLDPPKGYTTGIPDLDREIGGFPAGSTILMEVEPPLSVYEYACFSSPVRISYVLKDKPTLVFPSGGVDWVDLVYLDRSYGVSEDKWRKYMRILIDVETNLELPPNIKRIDLVSPEEVIKEVLDFVKQFSIGNKQPPLIILGMDRLAVKVKDAATNIAYFASNVISSIGGLVIFFVKPVYSWMIERLAPISDYHIKIIKKYGRVIVYGIKPRTQYYIVEPTEDNLAPRLIPIV